MFLLSLQPEIQINICKLQKIDQIELRFTNAHMFRPDFGCLDLPERLELPERPPKYRKDQRIIGNKNMLSTKFMLCNVLTFFGAKSILYVYCHNPNQRVNKGELTSLIKDPCKQRNLLICNVLTFFGAKSILYVYCHNPNQRVNKGELTSLIKDPC